MTGFEELEHNLAGRIKSIVILLFAVALVLQQTGRKSEIPDSTMEEANPIDEYFLSLEADLSKAGETRTYAHIYLDCWERELSNAYECLELQADALTQYYSVQAASDFEVYSESEGWLESFHRNTESQAAQAEAWNGGTTMPENSARETQLLVDRIFAQAELTRYQTMRIYSLLLQQSELSINDLFIFESKEAKQALQQSGCLPSADS